MKMMTVMTTRKTWTIEIAEKVYYFLVIKNLFFHFHKNILIFIPFLVFIFSQ